LGIRNRYDDGLSALTEPVEFENADATIIYRSLQQLAAYGG
jgi:hypothetical protein